MDPVVIKDLKGRDYLSLRSDQSLIRVQIHDYDHISRGPIEFVFDKRVLLQLISGLYQFVGLVDQPNNSSSDQRIDLLADNAKIKRQDGSWTYRVYGEYDRYLARLVASECAAQCAIAGDLVLSEQIKQHFGVKE